MVEMNRLAIREGLEDVQEFRQDTTVIETDIHYPTNNSLVWDCIKESERLLKHLKEEMEGCIPRLILCPPGGVRARFELHGVREKGEESFFQDKC